MIDTNDEWIRSRVGIAERRWAAEDETLVDMAAAAGGKALAATGLAPAEIDLVIVASSSLRAPIPSIGPQVAAPARHPRPGAFDLNAACAGFCYALGVADRRIRAGVAAQRAGHRRREALRRHRPDRPVHRVIFADGAGRRGGRRRRRAGHRPGRLGQRRRPVRRDRDRRRQLDDDQEGQAVFRWATTELAGPSSEAMEQAGVGPADIDVFVPHQANLRIIEAMAKRLGSATTPSSPATSSSRATPRRRRSRWR